MTKASKPSQTVSDCRKMCKDSFWITSCDSNKILKDLISWIINHTQIIPVAKEVLFSKKYKFFFAVVRKDKTIRLKKKFKKLSILLYILNNSLLINHIYMLHSFKFTLINWRLGTKLFVQSCQNILEWQTKTTNFTISKLHAAANKILKKNSKIIYRAQMRIF